MGSGWPGGGSGSRSSFDPTCGGHQVLRQTSVTRPLPWVVIGRSGWDKQDEAWTRTRRLLREIRRALTNNWFDSYESKGELRYEKPFLIRNVAERELNEAVNLGLGDTGSVRYTALDDHTAGNGDLTARVFDLLVADGVLVNPRVKDFRPIVSTSSVIGKVGDELTRVSKPITRDKVWSVDEQAADAWLAVRLILLDS